MDTVSILPADTGHIDGIIAIESVSFRRPWSRQTFVDEISNKPMSAYFVAVCGQTVLGYAGLSVMVDEGHIMNIAVHPGYRRKGIGQMLLDRLIRHAVENDVYALTLEVSVKNFAAIEFYKKNGFEINGVRIKYYGTEDAYIMWLFINTENSKQGLEDRL